MSRQILRKLLSYLELKPNQFWEGEEHKTLVGQNDLSDAIQDTLDELGIREGECGVYGVYLFGSVLKLYGKESHRRTPSDVDLYFWQRNPNSQKDRSFDMETRIGDVLQPKFHFYGLPLGVSSFPLSPDGNQRAGFIISCVYPLYKNINLVNRYNKQRGK